VKWLFLSDSGQAGVSNITGKSVLPFFSYCLSFGTVLAEHGTGRDSLHICSFCQVQSVCSFSFTFRNFVVACGAYEAGDES
jgi:hypothetical protein